MERCDPVEFPLFADLNAEEKLLVQTHWKEKHYQKGQTLFMRGRDCSHLFFIRSGEVKTTLLSSSGKEQVLETLGPGETCACHPPGQYSQNGDSRNWTCMASGEALSDCHVYTLSKESFARIFESIPAVRPLLNRLLAEKVRAYASLIEDISLRPSFERVAHFLLDNTVNFSQEELSRRLGIARETASRHLNKLKKMKLIDIRPQEIVILDKRGLEALVYGNNMVNSGG